MMWIRDGTSLSMATFDSGIFVTRRSRANWLRFDLGLETLGKTRTPTRFLLQRKKGSCLEDSASEARELLDGLRAMGSGRIGPGAITSSSSRSVRASAVWRRTEASAGSLRQSVMLAP